MITYVRVCILHAAAGKNCTNVDSYWVLELTVDSRTAGFYSMHMIVIRTPSFPQARIERERLHISMLERLS